MQSLQWIWDNREAIGAQLLAILASLTVLVHVMQRAAAAFGRLAKRLTPKWETDDRLIAIFARFLGRCDGALLSLSKWLPHIGINARKQWSQAERQARTSEAPREVA